MSNIKIFFFKFWPESTHMKDFWSKTHLFFFCFCFFVFFVFFLHETLHFDKFEGASLRRLRQI